MGIMITDLRQDRRHYYLRLGYSPDFYATLAAFENALTPDERHYVPDLRMWRVRKSAKDKLPAFFPNFEEMAAGHVGAARPIYSYVPWRKLVPLWSYAALALLAVFAWRTVTPAKVVAAAQNTLPAPVSRIVFGAPKQLALAGLLDSETPSKPLVQIVRPVSNTAVGERLLRARAVRDDHKPAAPPKVEPAAAAPQPAPAEGQAAAAPPPPPADGPIVLRATAPPGLPPACKAEGAPMGIVWVSAPLANLRDQASNDAKALGTSRRGEAICIYRIAGEWQGGTLESNKNFVWVHQSVLSVSPP